MTLDEGAAVSQPVSVGRLRAGRVLQGNYEVRRLLGRGGSSEVYEAYDRALGRRVAVKVCGLEAKRELTREAMALAAVRHTSLPVVYLTGEEESVAYMIFEHVRGVDLAAHLDKLRERHERMELRVVLDVLASLAEALSVIHRAGMAHRDVKPSNVMLSIDGRVVLVDMGIFIVECDTAAELAGTPGYIAPEVLSNSIAEGSFHLVDMYGLGLLAYEMFTGQPLLPPSVLAAIFAQQSWQHKPELAKKRPDLPTGIVKLVESLLDPNPARRPPNADLVARQLRKFDVPEGEPTQFSVLVVDDDDNVRALLETFVRRAAPDAIIRTVASGDEAMDQVRRSAPDLLIVDIHMPGMTGIELCMFLRGMGALDRCHIICVSGAAEEEEIAILYRMGILHFVPKTEHISKQLVPLVQQMRARQHHAD